MARMGRRPGISKGVQHLRPSLFELCVGLKPALQQLSDLRLGLWPAQRCPEGVEGVQETLGGRKLNLIDQTVRHHDGSLVESAEPAREGVSECIELAVRRSAVDISVSLGCVT